MGRTSESGRRSRRHVMECIFSFMSCGLPRPLRHNQVLKQTWPVTMMGEGCPFNTRIQGSLCPDVYGAGCLCISIGYQIALLARGKDTST